MTRSGWRSRVALLGVVITGGCSAGPARSAPPRLASRAARSPSTPRVYVLATVHGFHFKKAFGYTLSELRAEIRALRPNLVCFEVTPEHYGTAREVMSYPFEVAVAATAAREAGALPWPSDWRPPSGWREISRLVAEMTPQERRRYDGAYKRFMPRLQAAYGLGMFAFWHSRETQRLIRAAHRAMIDAATDVGAGFWDTRNQVIVKRCMRKALAVNASRVVFVFGGDHKYAIEHDLMRFYRIRAEPVVRLVPRSNDPLPRAVLERWRQLREQLIRLLASGTLPAEVVARVRARRVVARLQAAIDAAGRAR